MCDECLMGDGTMFEKDAQTNYLGLGAANSKIPPEALAPPVRASLIERVDKLESEFNSFRNETQAAWQELIGMIKQLQNIVGVGR